jgi:hypothetical protein
VHSFAPAHVANTLWFMTLEVLATDRKDDKHGDHGRRVSVTLPCISKLPRDWLRLTFSA